MPKKLIYLFIVLMVNAVLHCTTPIMVYQFDNIESVIDPFKPTIGNGNLTLTDGIIYDAAYSYPDSEFGRIAMSTRNYPDVDGPSEIAGVQIRFSTENFKNISIHWHVKHSPTAANRIRVQYTTNGEDWINFHANYGNSESLQITASNNLIEPILQPLDKGLFTSSASQQWYYHKLDLSSIDDLNDNPNFGVRFFTAHQSDKSTYIGVSGSYSRYGIITYGDISFYGVPAVSTPVADIKSGFMTEPISVNLSTKTSDATLYYVINNSQPVVYEEPINIDKTSTISFYGVKDDHENSNIVTETYTFYEEVVSLSILKTKLEYPANLYNISSEMTVSMVDKGLYFVQDSTAGIIIHDVFSNEYQIGDRITNIMGRISMVEGNIVMIPAYDNAQLISSNNLLIPIDLTVSELLDDIENNYQAVLVRIKNANFTPSSVFQHGSEYQIFDKSGDFTMFSLFQTSDFLDTPVPNNLQHITGLIVQSYICPRFFSDFEEIILAPSDLCVAVHKDVATLTWQAPDFSVRTLLGYNIYRDSKLINKSPIFSLEYLDENLSNGEYEYFVTAKYTTGESDHSNIKKVVIDYDLTSVDDDGVSHVSTMLIGNYPNPFNPTTVIKFGIFTPLSHGENTNISLSQVEGGGEGGEHVRIDIFNIKGQKIHTLVNDFYSAGIHTVIWNGTDDKGKPGPSGIYFYQMTVDGYTETRKMVLLK